jgi:uncharacterized membrane protein SpoIIM required for sporulation
MERRPRFGVRATLRAFAPYTLLAAGVFLATAVVGGAVAGANGASPLLPVRDGGEEIRSASAWYFFGHNAPIALWTMAGAALAGLPTLWVLGVNGFALGGTVVAAADGLGPLVTAALLVPHGVVELPALWLAGGVAFRWVHAGWRVANGDHSGPGAAALLGRSVVAVVLVVAALAVAAVVESSVMPALARVVAG